MAAPIVVDGNVTGALGASVFLDDLHARLNRELALPANYTWFVLDAEGTVMLDRDRDFIFMNALTQGGESLARGVSEAFTRESGAMVYEFEGTKDTRYRKLPGMNWWMFLARVEGAAVASPPRLKLSLEAFVPELQATLDRIDASLGRLIGDRPVDVADEPGLRGLLGALLAENPEVVDASFIDARGWLRLIEPSDYRNFENVDINDQAQVRTMLSERRPTLSPAFTAVEGFLCVDIARPLFDRQGTFVGSVSSLLRPEMLIGSLLAQSEIPKDDELWIMQTDGMILYDQDSGEIGRNLFTDPAYADYEGLLKLGREIAAEPEGVGTYIYIAPGSQDRVVKHAVWRTVGLHGQLWRVVLAYRPYE